MYVISDVLAPWGQVAAIILALYLFINIIIGLAFALATMFGLAWIREKVGLINKLRPILDSMNSAIEDPDSAVPAHGVQQKLVEAVHAVQKVDLPQKIEGASKQAQSIEHKVEQGTERVNEVVIEFRARTVMVQSMLKAFFLPGLAHQKQPVSLLEAAEKMDSNRAFNRLGTEATYSPEEATGDGIVAQPTLSDRVEDAQINPAGARQVENAPVR